jgi:hypothetical protein
MLCAGNLIMMSCNVAIVNSAIWNIPSNQHNYHLCYNMEQFYTSRYETAPISQLPTYHFFFLSLSLSLSFSTSFFFSFSFSLVFSFSFSLVFEMVFFFFFTLSFDYNMHGMNKTGTVH